MLFRSTLAQCRRPAGGPVLHERGEFDGIGINLAQLRVRGPVRTRPFGGKADELATLIESECVTVGRQRHAKRHADPPRAFHRPRGGVRITQRKRRGETPGPLDRVNLEHVVRGECGQPAERRRIQPAWQRRERDGQGSDAALNRFQPDAIAIEFRFRAIEINLQFGECEVIGTCFSDEGCRNVANVACNSLSLRSGERAGVRGRCEAQQ